VTPPADRARRAPTRRRRAKEPGGRVHRHYVRVSPEEEGRLLARAGAQGVSVPRLLVESALREEDPFPEGRREAIAELLRLSRALGGLATNVNQIARVANESGVVPPDAAPAIREARITIARIGQLLDDLAEA